MSNVSAAKDILAGEPPKSWTAYRCASCPDQEQKVGGGNPSDCRGEGDVGVVEGGTKKTMETLFGQASSKCRVSSVPCLGSQ